MLFKLKHMDDSEESFSIPLNEIKDLYTGRVTETNEPCDKGWPELELAENIDETIFLMELTEKLDDVQIMLMDMTPYNYSAISLFRKPTEGDYSSKINLGPAPFKELFAKFFMDYLEEKGAYIAIKLILNNRPFFIAVNVQEKPIIEMQSSETASLMDWFLEVSKNGPKSH